MWQIINIGLNVLIVLEVLYLFTSGQWYMKLAVQRNRRNFSLERWTYLIISLCAGASILYSLSAEPMECFLKLAVAFLFFRKCLTAYQHYRDLKAEEGKS